jgi:hypothetical protein
MDMEDQLKIGALYYECHLARDPKNRRVPWITTWVYLGYLHTPGKSSDSCDNAEHFYYFKEYEPTNSDIPPSEWKTQGIYIPTLKQVLESKLTWDEFWSYGLPKLQLDFHEEIQRQKRKLKKRRS